MIPLRPDLRNNLDSPDLKLIRYALSLILALTIGLSSRPANGQASPITVSVHNTHVSTDELVALIVTVVDDSPQRPQPILPPLDGLAVVDMDLSTDVRLVNGDIQTEATYTYFLQPRRTGLLIIPPVAVKLDEQLFEAQPISITVSQGAAPAPSPENAVEPVNLSPPPELAGQDFFVDSGVDLARPYVGQQIIYTFRFYQAIHLYREPQYDGPLFTGFETNGLPVRQYNFDAAGRTYLITEIRIALFPQGPGKITINPARLMLPGNIYEAPLELYTEPVQVEVQPLPGNAPPNFNGAVGHYEIKAWFSPRLAVVNQPTKLHIAISGVGNVHLLPEPLWPELAQWRGYDSLASFNTEMTNDLMTGTRVYERLMVPDQPGDYVIPAIPFVYFDPIAAEYRTISTEPLSVKVLPEPTPDPAALPITENPDTNISMPDRPQAASHWLDSLDLDRAVGLPAIIVLILSLCAVFPTAAIVGAGSIWLRRRGREASEQRAKAAEKQPVRPLAYPGQGRHPALTAALKETSDNYKTVSRALNAYLSHVLQTSANGLTRTDLAARLRRRGLDEALVARIEACLAESEIGRYSPGPPDAGWSLMASADELLFELDRAFRV